MVSPARVEVQKFVADRLGVDLDDLVLIADSDTSYTFRQKSTDQQHKVKITMGPEGPFVIENG